jgi:two-component system sensor histidine kinase CreC
VDEIAASAEVSGTARGIRIVVEPGPDAVVDGDVFLLRRAITNLVDNARDFSPQNGTITLALKRHRRTVDVTVRDHGPGIPDYAEDKVFEKFYSLARPHSKKRSTGLGLAFVKEIAELHQGRASLANASDGGAVASLSLPLAPGP